MAIVRRGLLAGAALGLALALGAGPALADPGYGYYGPPGWDHRHHHHDRGPYPAYVYGPRVVVPPPVIVAPPPVAYYPPPPPPVYYAPAVPEVNIVVPLRFR